MRILIAGKQHFDPGGIPASNDQLGHRLAIAGHDVAVLAHAAFDGPRPAEPWAVNRERGRSYEAWSVELLPPGAALGIVMRRFRPDVLVVNAGGAWWHDWTRALVEAAPPDIPLALYIRDAGAIELLGELGPHLDLVLANADAHVHAAARNGIDAVMIPSLVDGDLYRVEPTGEVVLFINPVASKGVETAFAIAAARPDVPFHFRESWHLPDHVRRALHARAGRLGNVEILPSVVETAEPYRRARLLLAPYEDHCRPRVVAEAQVSGIPVLARDDPGLRESVGGGGILVGADAGLEPWLAGLATLWDDPAAHDRYAAAARTHSRRVEMDPDHIAEAFVAALGSIAGRPTARRARAVTPSGSEARAAAPLASVIVPVRNVAATIGDQLDALAAQSYEGPWELVVSDNGSTDTTRQVVERWGDRFPSLRIVDSGARRGVAHARNVGLRSARGELLLICDGDDIVAPDWLALMVAALEEHPIVTGFIDVVTLNRPEQYAWMGVPTRDAPPVAYHHLPYAPGGNIGMWRDVFESLSGFDEALLRAEDIDFGWRANALGIPVHLESRAVLHRRLRPSPWSELRSGIRGGIAEAGLYRRHQARGMASEPMDDVRTQYRWLLRSVPDVVTGRANRYRVAHHAGKRIGRAVGSARERVRYL